MAETVQVHLTGKGFSGRAVRYRILSIEAVDLVEQFVAGLPDIRNKTDLPMLTYNNAIALRGVSQMLVAMTEPVAADDLPKAKWLPCTPEMFDKDIPGSKALSDYFTTKDIRVLRTIYLQEHDAGKAEVDAILAGKVGVVD
jgi:hypothetical protein